ncbi:conjugal transfer protein TraN [Geomonas subterranea]|uniref:conjugal transfer protein TraN n=1 Tax=Geomonas subterranea TaxID=2847989 RepID=UPI001CD79623|nr:conjugal transfer protein TraN [Geomonas fuzhouensis]
MLEKIKSKRLLFRMVVWAMVASSSGVVETAGAVTTCDKDKFEGFFLAPDTKSTIAITKQAFTWDGAAAAAKAAGGRLVVVTGAEQNSAISTSLGSFFTNISTVTSTPQKKAWIDLVDPLNSPAWSVEGSPAVVMPSRFSWADDFSSFSNWASGQPDGYCPATEQAINPDHNCYGEPWATINGDGTWSDEGNHSANSATLKGVVEWPLVTLDCVAPVSPPVVTDPSPLPGADAGAMYCTDSTKTQLTKCNDTTDGSKSCPNDRVACNAVTEAPRCPPGSTLNTERDMCQADPAVVCAAGYTWDASVDKCVASAVCSDGGVLNPATDQCEKLLLNACPAGYSYDGNAVSPTYGKCIKAVECTSGTFNVATDRCEATTSTYSCSDATYTYNAGTARCEKAPVCPSGMIYNAAYNVCTQAVTVTCGVGYTLNSSTNRCEKAPPTCMAGTSYNGTTDRCEAPPACDSGNYNPATDVCESSSVRVMEMTNSISLNGYMYNAALKSDGTVIEFRLNNPTSLTYMPVPAGSFKDLYNLVPSGSYLWMTAVNTASNQREYYQLGNTPIASFSSSMPNLTRRSASVTRSGYTFTCSIDSSDAVSCTRTNNTTGLVDLTFAVPSRTDYAAVVDVITHVDTSSNVMTFATFIHNDGTLSRFRLYSAAAYYEYVMPTFSLRQTVFESAAVCPSGTVLNGTADKCVGNPTCSGGNFDPATDVCYAAYTPSCSQGTYDAASGFCITSPACSNGTLDSTADLCYQPNPVANCGTMTWDSAAGICYSAPVCALGSYDATLNICTSAIVKDCGTYTAKDATTCQLAPSCPSDPNFSQNSTIAYSAALDKCVSQAQHDCVTGTTYNGLPIEKCEAVPICVNGMYSAAKDTCYNSQQTCPVGNFECKALSGDSTEAAPGIPMQYCSPNTCQSDTSGWITNTDTESGIDDKKNDGERGTDGNCLGSIYLYNGTDMRCRLRDLKGATNSYLQLAAMIALSVTGAGAALAGALGATAGSTAAAVIEATVQMAVSAAIDAATTGVDAMGVIISGVGAMAGAAAGNFADVGANGLGDMVADTVASLGLSSGIDVLADPALSNIIQQIGNTVEQYQPEITQGLLANYSATKCCYPDKMSGGCNPEEFTEAKLAGNGACHIIGSYCSTKVLAFCMVKKQTSCCFSSKLARIFHEQGRPQLTGFGPDGAWGMPRHPNCRGFTPEEFQSLNFGAMDLSEYIEDLNARMDQVKPLLDQYMGTFGDAQKTKLNNQFQSGVPQQ